MCSDTSRGKSGGWAGKRLTASWAKAQTPGLSEGISRAASSGNLGCDLVLRWTERGGKCMKGRMRVCVGEGVNRSQIAKCTK